MNVIKSNIVFLQAIGTLPEAQVKELLKTADRAQTVAIAEVIKNVLARVIRLPPDYKEKLRKHKDSIRTIADNKVTLKERQEALAASTDIVSLLIKGVLKRLLTLAK